MSPLTSPSSLSSPYSTHCQILSTFLDPSSSPLLLGHCLRPGYLQLLLDMCLVMPHLAASIADYDYSLSKTLYGSKIYSKPLNLAPQNAHSRTLAASLTIPHLLPSTIVQPNFFQSPTLLYALSPGAFTYAGFFTWNTLLTLSM